MWACFGHNLKDFNVGVTHPHDYISASPYFGTFITCKCAGGLVEWAGPAGIKKCPKFGSWTLLASI